MAYAGFGLTDPGIVRTYNEDHFQVFVVQDTLFMVVADGLGARPGKEVASVVAIRELRLFLERYLPAQPPIAGIQYLLEQGVFVANRAVRSYILANPERYEGWGTTLTAVAMTRNYEMASVHVGNSRLYQIHGQDIRLLTKDHTEAQSDIDMGRIQESERWTHPGRQALTRGIGMNDRITPDTFMGVVQRQDLLLLTTDGVHGILTDQALIRIVYDAGNTKDGVAELIQATKEAGAPDNLAAVLTYCEY